MADVVAARTQEYSLHLNSVVTVVLMRTHPVTAYSVVEILVPADLTFATVCPDSVTADYEAAYPVTVPFESS